MRATLPPCSLAPLLAFLVLPLAGCDPDSRAAAIRIQDASGTRATAYLATSVGRVDSATEARQRVASADGVIARLRVARGQKVRAGQILLSIDCGPCQAMARAQAAQAARSGAMAATVMDGAREQETVAAEQTVRSVEAGQSDARDRLAQAEALTVNGFISRRELAARQNALAMADAALAKARAEASLIDAGPRLSERRAALSAASAASAEAMAATAQARQCDLVSPIDGEVLQIFRREGEFSGASQGTPLIAVGDLSRLVVRAEIPERDAAWIAPGQAADVWIEGGSERWRGRIATLAQVMGRRSARSLDPTDRFDRDSREAFVTFDGPMPPALVGLRVIVGIKP